MDGLIAIGEFSAVCQLSVKMLRYYHDVGLLEPARVDPLTGYRYYRADQAAVAVSIRELRRVGMPVGEIRTLVRARDPEEPRAILARHRERLAGQLVDAENRMFLIEQLVGRECAMTDDITEVELPRLRVATKRVEGPQAMTVPLVAAAFAELRVGLQRQEVAVVGPPMQIVHYGDEERFEHEACIPIASEATVRWCRGARARRQSRRGRPQIRPFGSGLPARSLSYGMGTRTRTLPGHALPGDLVGHAATVRHSRSCRHE